MLRPRWQLEHTYYWAVHFSLKWDDTRAVLKRAYDDTQLAVSEALDDVQAGLKDERRGQVQAAEMGTRLANTWRGKR